MFPYLEYHSKYGMIYQNTALDTPGHNRWSQSTEAKLEGNMSSKNYSGVSESSSLPVEKTAKFTSRWAIPRVEPAQMPTPTRKKRQIKNIVVLFIIYVFKQIKKSMFTKRLKVKYRAMAKGHK
jgi:hypothetical protein